MKVAVIVELLVCFKDDSSEEDESSEEEEKPELLGRGRRTAVLEARTRVCAGWVRVLEARSGYVQGG